MIVRKAIKSDQDAVVKLLRESSDNAGFTNNKVEGTFRFEWSYQKAVNLFKLHITLDNAQCWVIEKDDEIGGILLAVVSEHPFAQVIVAKETVLYITPTFRGHIKGILSILRTYEEWSKLKGAQFVGLGELSQYPEVSKLYNRIGYSPVETLYMKAIK